MKVSNLFVLLLLASLSITFVGCMKEKTPVSMTITQVLVKSFPNTNANGDSWDFGSNADLYIKVLVGGTTLYESNSSCPNMDGGGGSTCSYTPASALVVSSPTSVYTLELWDLDDVVSDQRIATLPFTPFVTGSNEKNEKLQTLTFSSAGCVFSVNFTYNYK